MHEALLTVTCVLYKNLLKPILFLIDPEKVHHYMVMFGEWLGRSDFSRKVISFLYLRQYPELEQNLFGVDFKLPIGLAAGFDYEARLTQILPEIGFGFGTAGTLTYLAYDGNKRPMLGRLPKSQSLMVNKGFKNLGVEATLKRLKGYDFEYPFGISIGKTNTAEHKTQEEGIEDVVSSFKITEKFEVPFLYYELNISCPNVAGTVEFYKPENLRDLLRAVESLKIKRAVFIKMPISKTNEEISAILDVIVEFPFVKGIIIGNLQRDRNNPKLVPEEVAKFSTGNFSGKACQNRSDELIQMSYAKYGDKIKIIGCGGVFCAEDAYKKIRLGATLVQMITGMIFEGPGVVSEINAGLVKLLKKDGFKNISEAVGIDINNILKI